MKRTYNHRSRGYTYRRIGVGLIAFMPFWLAYCFIGSQSIIFTLLSAIVVVLPTAGLAGALFTVADSELELAHYLEKKAGK
jgi:hypothetical protein